MASPSTAPSTTYLPLRFALWGAFFGFLIPLGATFIESIRISGGISLWAMGQAQSGSPLMWIIDSAPFVIGSLSWYLGKRQIRINELLARLKGSLHESHLVQDAIIDSSNYLIFSTDSVGNILTFNPYAEQQLQYSAEEVINQMNPISFFAPKDLKKWGDKFAPGRELTQELAFEALIHDSRLSGDTGEVQMTLLSKSGREIISLLSVVSIRDEHDILTGFLFVAKDITELKRVEEDLRDREQSFRAVFDSATAGIVLLLEEEIFKANRAFAGMLGYEPEDVIGRDLTALMDEENRQKFRKKIRSLLRHPQDREAIMLRLMHRSAMPVWGKVAFSILRSPSGEVDSIMAIVEDETENFLAAQKEKQYRQNLEKLNQDMKKTNRELDQFAYIVSHDLKAPLRAITSLAEWIEEDLQDNLDPGVKDKLELLRSRAYRMQNLITGILDYTRIGRVATSRQQVDLQKLLSEILDTLDIPEGFTVTYPDNLPHLLADRTQVYQVFSNLIGNAIKYHDREDGKIEIECEQKEGYFKFTVKDDGPGIESQYHEKIFSVFQRLESRDQTEGTGIGLSIVKKIVEENGGKVGVQSVLGQGASFSFTWPA